VSVRYAHFFLVRRSFPTLDVMKSGIAVWAILGLSLTAGISGYWLGRFTEAKIIQIQDEAALGALRLELGSKNPDEVEHALWLTLGDLRVLERRPSQAMTRDIAAMEVAITYAKLAQMSHSLNQSARSELLMKHAISTCQKTASPNCNAEALASIARRLSAPAATTK